MFNATIQSHVSDECFGISDDEIRARVAEIRSKWSDQECAQRKSLGRARQQMLLASLGLISHRDCA